MRRTALLLTLLAAMATALRSPLGSASHDVTSRRAAIGGAAALLLPTTAVFAADKYDKAFEECLSKCVYMKTKIAKGIAQVEVVSRADAFKECKKECATDPKQLLLGTPK